MSEFLPRGACAGWTPWMLWAIDIADEVIVLGYLCLPALMWKFLVYLAETTGIKLPKVPLALTRWYIAFIAVCGLTHQMDVNMTWFPEWRLDVVFHCIQAVAVAGAFIAVWQAWPGAKKN